MVNAKSPTSSPWSTPEVVARFATSPPNGVLVAFAKNQQRGRTGLRLLDIGCGAGSNAVPLARLGWNVLGIDLSVYMLQAAEQRAKELKPAVRLRFECAPMDRLPVEDASYDFIVAHGVWNLARSATEFRAAVREAARAAKPGASLFVYTFSRSTLPPETEPVAGDSFVFTEFSGQPQCFLTRDQLIEELGGVGFHPEPGRTIQEYPRLPPGTKPSIYEGIFRRNTQRIPKDG